MDINSFVVSLRKFAVHFTGFFIGGFVASQIEKDNWKVRAVGQAIGWITAMRLDEAADNIQAKESRKSIDYKDFLEEQQKNYRTDHADRIKSEPKQQSSLNL